VCGYVKLAGTDRPTMPKNGRKRPNNNCINEVEAKSEEVDGAMINVHWLWKINVIASSIA
jgi:hypothetical protein